MIMGTLGFDNIAIAFALGPLQLGRRSTLLLGLWFGFAEAGMTLLGSAFGHAWLPTMMMTTDATRAGVLATLAVAVLALAWIGRRPEQFVANPSALAVLALLLGLDNLIAGSMADALVSSPGSIVAAGALVGTLAAAACAAGGALFRPVPRWGALTSAVMLTGLAVAGIA
jgi:hypothetical protein